MGEYRVELADDGPAFACERTETVLHAALRQRVGFPYECSTGACGTCRFELVAGAVETLWADAPGLNERMRARGNRHLACQSRPLGDLIIKARPEERCLPTFAPGSWTATLAQRRDLTRDMAEFTFHTGVPAAFAPGQYILLHGAAVAGARAYSMANLANAAGEWRLIVKRRGGGALTRHLFEVAAPGEPFALNGPYGMAHLRAGMTGDIVCIAGGSGLSPMLSVVRGALEQGHPRRVALFYGARAPDDLVTPADLGELGGWCADPANFTAALSEPPDGWTGASGFIHDVVARSGRLADEADVFVAGPPPMIEATLAMLAGVGVARGRIHFDSFY